MGSVVLPPIAIDLIGQVVALMQSDPQLQSVRDAITDISPQNTGMPYYLFGHREEINQQLVEKDRDSVYKYQKYPAVALRLDIPEEVGDFYMFTLNIAILAFTDSNYNSQQRLDNVFRPVLYPLYASLLRNIKKSGLFTWDVRKHLDNPPHNKIDRYYYGTIAAEGNAKHVFSDPIDAIELIDLKINARAKC